MKEMTVEMTFEVKIRCGSCEYAEWMDDEDLVICEKSKCKLDPDQWCAEFALEKGIVKDTFWIKREAIKCQTTVSK